MNRLPVHLVLMLVLVITLAATRMLWMDTRFEYMLTLAGIFLTGIPHGAMDHETASYLHGPRFPLFRYVLNYLLSALLYLGVWYFFPGIAFLLFLLFTSWHFGETDLQCFGKQTPSAWLIFFYGWSLLMWLLLGDTKLILEWTNLITGSHPAASGAMALLTSIPHGLWFITTAALLLLTVYRDKQRLTKAILFLCFVWMASRISLLPGFMVYFAGWHSWQALQHLQHSVFKGSGIIKMFRKAIPALAGASLLLILILYLGDESWLENNGLPSLFILLAILTLPHMAQMHKLYQFRFRSRKSR